jgi:hypothetical protein
MARRNLTSRRLDDLAENYQLRPKLSEYINLRRTAGFSVIDSNRFFNLDLMLLLDGELKKYQIDPLVVAKVLDGNDLMVDELCLQVMESIESRRSLEHKGRKHVQARKEGIPDSLVDFLIVFALEACEQNGLVVPPSLVVLVRERLGGSNPARYEGFLASQKRQCAIQLAINDIKNGKKVSTRKVAKIMKVQPSTVKRWFPNSSLEEEAKVFFDLVKYVRSSGPK